MADLLQRRQTLHQQAGQAAEQLRQLEAQLTDLQPLANLGLAWSMTAHELNNLLMPVMNYARLALASPEDEVLSQKALETSLLFSERVGPMVEKIMQFAGRGRTEKKHCRLGTLVDDVFACLGRDFEKDRIHVTRTIDPQLEVWADETALRQVLMNLILNARNAMLARGGRLTLTAEATADGIRIQISGTGDGMPPERLKAIFTPFYTAGPHKGNGLGLAFCRKVIDAHGGYIQADSRPQKGTTFKIVLPKHPL